MPVNIASTASAYITLLANAIMLATLGMFPSFQGGKPSLLKMAQIAIANLLSAAPSVVVFAKPGLPRSQEASCDMVTNIPCDALHLLSAIAYGVVSLLVLVIVANRVHALVWPQSFAS